MPGRGADAEALTTLYLRSRSAAMPWLVSPYEVSTRWWMEHVVLHEQQVFVAWDDDRALGFAALESEWLTQLYVEPAAQGEGVGRLLVGAVKDERPGGLWLHVFRHNTRARRFYEAVGFGLTAYRDTSANEEHEPDCTYVWPAP